MITTGKVGKRMAETIPTTVVAEEHHDLILTQMTVGVTHLAIRSSTNAVANRSHTSVMADTNIMAAITKSTIQETV